MIFRFERNGITKSWPIERILKLRSGQVVENCRRYLRIRLRLSRFLRQAPSLMDQIRNVDTKRADAGTCTAEDAAEEIRSISSGAGSSSPVIRPLTSLRRPRALMPSVRLSS